MVIEGEWFLFEGPVAWRASLFLGIIATGREACRC